MPAVGQVFVHQQAAATVGVVGGAARDGLIAQAQPTVGIGGVVELHPFGLIGTTVGGEKQRMQVGRK